MGTVYLADQLEPIRRRVALKVVKLGMDTRQVLARFANERQALAIMDHPNIARIFDAGATPKGRPYFVMEYIEGEPITQYCDNRRMAILQRLELFLEVCRAVHHAHQKGVIHRDLKPSNVLVMEQEGSPVPKVIDFGIAKATEQWAVQKTLLTEFGQMVGTPEYASPEQAEVMTGSVDERSDVYSLGVLLYELLIGTVPFDAAQLRQAGFAEMLRIIREEDAPPLTRKLATIGAAANIAARRRTTPPSLRRLVDGDLNRITLKALEKARERRYPSVAELAADVQRYLGHRPVLASPPGAVYRVRNFLRRHRPTVSAAGSRGKRNAMVAALAVALAVALGMAGWLFFLRKTPALTNKDTVVLASFTNTTGDPIFDGTLRRGLSVQLEQSPFLSIVPDQQIQQALQMMGQKPDAKLTPEIAQDLCQRVGSAAVIEGSIAQIGMPYLLTVKAVDCSTGGTLASAEAQASDKSRVLDALGKASSEIRRKLGESLSTVQRFDTPLEQATTPSLEALKAFSSGYEIMGSGGPPLAIRFFKQAVALDPNFAAAYAWLGIQYTSLGEPAIAAGYTRRAYELRDRTSEPERYLISAIYHKEVTGNIPQAVQSCKLWKQAYPRAEMPHEYLAAAIYPVLGEYEDAVEECKESIRLDPEDPLPYAFLMVNATSLNRLDEAKAAYEQAVERKLHSPWYPLALYRVAFLEHDTAGMSRQVAISAGQPPIEDELLSMAADTAAYSGQLSNARELSSRAVDSAQRAGETEVAATYSAHSALREALFGNAGQAKRDATLAMQHSPGVDGQFESALALAYIGDEGQAQALTAELGKRFPEYTIVQFNYLPTLHAELALEKGDVSAALRFLRSAAPYELGSSTYGRYRWTSLYPVYQRGEAYLAAHEDSQAVAQFEEILDHSGVVANEPIGALARLQLGRAYALEARSLKGADADAARAKARAAYRDFLMLWKYADPDIPVLKKAKAEYAKLD